MGKKVFTGKNVDLAKLAAAVESYLSSQGYTTQRYQASDQSYIVQAKKGGLLRALISAQRAFTIHISGNPQNVAVNVGVANWGQDIAVDAVETVLFGDLALISDAETLWNLKIERDIMKEIQRLIDSGQVAYVPAAPQMPQQPYYQTQPAGYGQGHKFCPMCGAQNPVAARYCMSCGAQFPS